MEDLELYPRIDPVRAAREGWRSLRANWKRLLAYGVALVLVFGVAGYRWVTTATPMDRSNAVELFRGEQADVDGVDPGQGAKDRSRGRATDRKRSERGGNDDQRRGPEAGGAAAGSVAAARATRERSRGSGEGADESRFTAPQEGVYSWATEGYEQVSGARREFPKETQRIITLSGNRSWTEHHYFSEEREIWTQFQWGARGAEVTEQRNKVKFGPVTNESMIDFVPAMLVGPRDLRVGYEWGGKWSGDTSGDYSSKIFERSTLVIGGEEVEVWGISYEIDLRGEQEGKVTAQVWLAPAEGLTVKEHYVQNVESSGARYQAEWEQTLKSLEPRR